MLFQFTTESLVGGERLRRLVVHWIICTKKLVQNVLFAKDLPIRMIRISCKTILSGNGNILNSRQQFFQACHFGENIFLQRPCLHNMRGLFLECIFTEAYLQKKLSYFALPNPKNEILCSLASILTNLGLLKNCAQLFLL